MYDLKDNLKNALEKSLAKLEVKDVDIPIQEVPDNKPGDYGSALAFGLAKTLRKNPALIAKEIVDNLDPIAGIAKVETVGPYINFFVDSADFIKNVVESDASIAKNNKKVIIEHTSINPNKEAHVGHLRNISLGDAMSRIFRANGHEVEVQNYIDDTGRQAAESLYAIEYFNAKYDGSKKYDHWLGELYVKLQTAKETDAEKIEAGVSEIMHRLEQGQLRNQIEQVVKALLQSSYSLGVEYDLLVWESDIVESGFLSQALEVLKQSDNVYTPKEGKYADALVMDVSKFLPGLEENEVVLVRSDGNAMYVAKDIGNQFWKVGLFKGIKYQEFETQPSKKTLYTTHPKGKEKINNHDFANGDIIINVIDTRQSHPQTIVRTALKMTDASKASDFEQSHHLAYEVVTLEGQAISGRKGITVSIDDVIAEAVSRARAVIAEKNPELPAIDEIAKQVGIGALKFSMIKTEAKKIIDFRWEQALSLQGDSAPYIQYAHARAASILRAAKEENIDYSKADWSKLGDLELKLARVIAKLPEAVKMSSRDLSPHILAQYGLELATTWNSYYNHKDENGKPDTRILLSESGQKEARLLLVEKLKSTLAQSLYLLGIESPEQM
ncbi:MAG TPA: arginine--tRNA ligase [Trueperaceae bacterium]|nr:arginine--tRNA ligase [Trueperaceae bacterium]